VGHINAQRRHLGFELPPLQIIAMATIDGLKPYPLEIAATRRREQILIVNALGCAGATTRLVDEFSHDALASSAGLGSQACELIRNAKAMLNLVARRAAQIQSSAFHRSSTLSSSWARCWRSALAAVDRAARRPSRSCWF